MINIGQYNTLIGAERNDYGFSLRDEAGNLVLLPNRYVPADFKAGERIDVFVYNDSEDRPVATTEKPKLTLNQIAFLKLVNVNTPGAFFDWGLPKDLFVPYREFAGEAKVGMSYLVYLYLDEKSNRLAGSTKLSKFLKKENEDLEEAQEVDILIWQKRDIGYRVIINQEYMGLMYHDEIFEKVFIGQAMKAYVKTIREDGKIDVCLQKQGYQKVEPMAERILKHLERNNGKSPLNDKSDPDEIREVLGMSKKNFKKAIGTLYKQRIITIEKNGIRLN